MIGFYSRFAISTFGKRKLRSWLTMLGIFIGIAAIVSLISLGQGLKTAVTAQFAALGTDRIIIQAKSVTFLPPGQGTVAKITTKDLDHIEKIPGVAMSASRILQSGKAEFNDRTKFVFVGSMPKTAEGRRLIEDSFRFKTAKGRLLQQGDRKKVVVGNAYLKKSEFGKPLNAGDRISINGEQFEVIGVLQKLGQPQFDGIIMMPEEAMRELYDIPEEISAIVVQSAEGLRPEVVGDRIAKELRSFRNVKEGKEDFTVQTSGQLLGAFENILNIVTAVLVGIAAISLLVGGIGIMNTMYTSVLERTNEIGVMKSVGARNKDIFFIFFVESGMLGFAGGAIGIAIGIGLSKLVEFSAAQILGSGLVKAFFPWYLILGALLFSFIVGAVSGTLPAMQASRMNPVDALRYE